MEEVFGDGGCAGGNPLRSAVHRLTGETTPHDLHFSGPEEARFFDEAFAEQRQLVDSHRHVDSFFGRGNWDELDPSFGEPLEAQHIPGDFERRLNAPALPPQERDAHLKDVFKDFWAASRQGQTFWPRGADQLASSLSSVEKQKIRNRTDVTLRHLNPEPRQADSQLGALFSELRIAPQHRAARQETGSDWASEFGEERWQDRRAQMRGAGRPGDWASEFSENKWVDDFARFERAQGPQNWAQEYERFDEQKWRNMNEAWSDSVSESWADTFLQTPVTPLEQRIQYQQYLNSLSEEDAAAELKALATRFIEHPDPKFQNSKFREMMAGLSSGELKVEDKDVVEARPQQPLDRPDLSNLTNWLSEYESFEGAPRERTFEDFERDFGHLFPNSPFQSREYEFQQNNPFLGDPQCEAKGRDLFARGELGDAILAFEAAAQANPEYATAWRLLGQAHAENDRDDRAITALTRACQLDSNDAEALLALAVSCINDSYRDQALQVLQSWLSNNPRYQEHMGRWNAELGSARDVDMIGSLTYMFIEAAKLSPTDPDENVQIALGLLFNVSGEYDKAVDCFRTALKKRPDDYLLWNKLGATLANSNHSKEALEPYYTSLSLKPTYTRARANLGISYLNLEMYPEAATAFLQSLALQPTARHLWMSLHTVFSRMNRDDLLEKSLSYDIERFRGDFDF